MINCLDLINPDHSRVWSGDGFHRETKDGCFDSWKLVGVRSVHYRYSIHFFENFDPKWPFLPQISTQKAKFDQKHFFRDPEVLRFPTRGHMPMFEKVQFFGPETGRRARILENRNFREKSGFPGFGTNGPKTDRKIELFQT